MTRPNAGTRQLAINLPTVDYDRLAQAADAAGLSMTLATRKAIATWTARQIGRYVPEPVPASCPGSGLRWSTAMGIAICPACGCSWGAIGLAKRPARKTTTVPDHALDEATGSARLI